MPESRADRNVCPTHGPVPAGYYPRGEPGSQAKNRVALGQAVLRHNLPYRRLLNLLRCFPEIHVRKTRTVYLCFLTVGLCFASAAFTFALAVSP